MAVLCSVLSGPPRSEIWEPMVRILAFWTVKLWCHARLPFGNQWFPIYQRFATPKDRMSRHFSRSYFFSVERQKRVRLSARRSYIKHGSLARKRLQASESY